MPPRINQHGQRRRRPVPSPPPRIPADGAVDANNRQRQERNGVDPLIAFLKQMAEFTESDSKLTLYHSCLDRRADSVVQEQDEVCHVIRESMSPCTSDSDDSSR